MSNITSKILGLGGMAIMFAGVSFGQAITCGAATVSNVILDRVEDTTALVGDVSWTCAAGANPVETGASATVSLNEPVTSKILVAASATSDAVLIINDTTSTGYSAVYQGIVAGNSILFNNITIPAGTDTFTIRTANVRVNSSLAPATGNFAITESLSVNNAGASVFISGSPTVGVVVQAFNKPSLVAGSVANYPLCTGNPVGTATNSFSILVSETPGGMFKMQAPGAFTITNGDQGSYTGSVGASATPATAGTGVQVTGFSLTTTGGTGGAAVAGLGTATHGTRYQFVFTGIPTGATVYVPLTIVNGTLTMTLTASATGALSPLASNAPATHSAAITAASYGLTATAGVATAVYEVTATSNVIPNESFTLTGVVVAPVNVAATAQPAITVIGSPSPATGTDIPTFAASSNTALNLTAFNLCQTTMLFPFVAAGGGFDTGIAISNTGLDPYPAGFTAAGTSGSCTFNFYGTGAPSPSTGVSLPTATFPATLAAGATGSFSLAGSSVAPNFVGYMIAQCGFLYGHGFGYITYNQGAPSADAQGYLAIVLGTNRSPGAVPGPEAVTF
jgi:hypothetical protein